MAQPAAVGVDAVTLQAQQPPGPEVEFAEAPDEAAEAAGIADWLVRAGRGRRRLPRDGGAVPDQRPVAGDRAGAGRPRHSVPGPRRRAVLRAARGAPGAADAAHRGPGAGRMSSRASGGAALEQVKAVLGALGWTPQPPEGAGAVRERWESLAALFSVAEDLRPTRTIRPTRWTSAVDLGRARSAGRGPARAGGPGGHGRRPCTRPRAWSGTRSRCSASTRDRCRSCSPPHPSSRPRSAGCCTSGSPGPGGCCASPGRGPATAAATPASRRGSSTPCCPMRCAVVGRASRAASAGAGRRAVGALPVLRASR